MAARAMSSAARGASSSMWPIAASSSRCAWRALSRNSTSSTSTSSTSSNKPPARRRTTPPTPTTIARAAPWKHNGEAAASAAPSDSTDSSTTTPMQMRTDLRVVLYRPQIPQNAGNAARTAAATGVPLELVAPLGFRVDDAKLKRAGLDYWHSVCARVHEPRRREEQDGWPALLEAFDAAPLPKRLVAFTVYGARHYAGPSFSYQPGDWLLFGSETEGLPPAAHGDVLRRGGALVKIPMRGGARSAVRSLNLATSVGVGVFEALRQLDADRQEGVEPRDDSLWRATPMAAAAAAAAAAAERAGGE